MSVPGRAPLCTSNHLIKALAITLFIVTQAHAQFIIQPMLQRKTLCPGESKDLAFRLENRGRDAVYVRITANDIAKEQNKTWILLDPNAPEYAESLDKAVITNPSCASWMTLPEETVQLVLMPPQSEKRVDVTLTVPADANGQYWAGMKFALVQPPEAKLKIRYDFVVPIELTIASPETEYETPTLYHSITPAVIDLQGRPGQTVNTSLALFKSPAKGEPLSTQVTIESLEVSDVNEFKSSRSDALKSCKSWLSWSVPNQEASFAVEPNEPTRIPISMEIPAKAHGCYNSILHVKMSHASNLSDLQDHTRTKYSLFIPMRIEATNTPPQESRSPGEIVIYNKGNYELQQDASSERPFFTYIGEEFIQIQTPMPMQIRTSMKAVSRAGGDWTCCPAPDLVQDNSIVKLNFSVKNLDISQLPARETALMSELEIKLIPQFSF